MSGEGKFYWASGEVYFGKFADGKRSGNGVLKDIKGRQYVGIWDAGKKNGTFEVYEPEFKDSDGK